jgi:hypothetical protein
MIIYIDRRQYVLVSEIEKRVAREIFYERATLRGLWGEGVEQRHLVRSHCLRQLRRLRTDFFEARMLRLARECSELVGDPAEHHVEAEAMAREERALVGA